MFEGEKPRLGVGWRAKLGILVPSINYVMEPELNKMAPEGVSVHATRLKAERKEYGSKKDISNFFVSMAENAEKEAELLGCVADVIGFGCTSGSFFRGMKWNENLIKRIEKVAGVPATTTSTAMLEALKEMGIKKLGLATPYSEVTNRLEKKFLEDNGFKVISMRSCGCTVHGTMGEYSPYVAYRLGKEVNTKEADGIFISCTNFRTIEILEKLERDINKPVISSNSATMWKMLRMAGVHEPIVGYGELLKRYW